jgi:hypothetical protein
MNQVCKCGKVEGITTGGNLDRFVEYDSTGQIVYAICQHGFAYIDKRKPPATPSGKE